MVSYGYLKRKTRPSARMRSLGTSMARARKRQTNYRSRVAMAKKRGQDAMNRFTATPSGPVNENVGLNPITRTIAQPAFGYPLSKVRIVSGVPPTQRDSRTLYNTNLTDISQGSLINQRDRSNILLKGFHIKFDVRNQALQTVEKRLWLRCAVVQPITSNSVSTTDFFRSYTNERSEDFGPPRAGWAYYDNPINADEYRVIKSWKVELGGLAQENQNKNTYTVSEYIPINRRVFYDTDAGTTCTTKFFFVYWAEIPIEASAGAPTADAFTYSSQHLAYFDDN